ncbi:MAG: YdeI/OmpD-associated family protein [Steroidobacteraceae bacterium]
MSKRLVAAFARNARARAFFETLDGTNRYAILYRVQTKKPRRAPSVSVPGFSSSHARRCKHTRAVGSIGSANLANLLVATSSIRSWKDFRLKKSLSVWS